MCTFLHLFSPYMYIYVYLHSCTVPVFSLQCREFVKAGALKGNNPADVVQSCDITFTCVADSTAVRDVGGTVSCSVF